ncbi:MAG: EamA family transporter [Acidobacteria bacterium]|nr:EamA family transporter [Acidobacteriota bacterium]
MAYLVLASLLWAVPFGLIKRTLTDVDPTLVAWIRLVLACLAFAGFLRPAPWKQASKWMLIGAVQFGAMYVLYIRAFQYLSGSEVALLTITTPLWVSLMVEGRRSTRLWCAAGIAVFAAALLQKTWNLRSLTLVGILLVQLANVCFAWGQLRYRKWCSNQRPEAGMMAWLYLGALVVPTVMLAFGSFHLPSRPDQWGALLYLGLVPTALGFYLWNRGSRFVPAAVLAVANNLKIPLAILLAWTVFGEKRPDLVFLASAVLFGVAFAIAPRQRG